MNKELNEDIIQMLNDEYEERKIDEKLAELKEKRSKRYKKQNRRARVAAALYITAGIAIGSIGTKAKDYFNGKEEIYNEFHEITKDYSISNGSKGYNIIKDGKEIPYEQAVNEMIDEAYDAGMNTAEISIGLSCQFNSSAAKTAMGDEYPSFSERYNTCVKNLYEKELEGNNKGNGK